MAIKNELKAEMWKENPVSTVTKKGIKEEKVESKENVKEGEENVKETKKTVKKKK
jgi:hypothetical protein